MKLKFILILQLFIFTACPTLMAQPAAVKNVAKSVFSLTTFSADGSLLANSHGVFVGADGEAVSDLKPFIGAAKAVVVDAQGNKMNVTRILGLNELYDVIRFRVDGKTTPANIANVASTYQQDAWLVTYAMKSPQIVATKVKSVEKFMDKYSYYIFGMNAPDNSTGCPFVNMYGQVIGLLQMSNTSFDTHAVDVSFIRTLTASGFSVNDANFKKIGIPAAMPADESQARIMLIMSGQSGDSLKHVAAVNDFIQAFPLLNDGYNARAILEANAQQWNNAEETMKTAIKKATLKDEAHYNFAKLQYDNAIYGRHWTLDGAYEEVSEAYKLNPAPLYRHLQAQIHYAKNDYQQALEILQQLSQDKQFSTPELLYEQALCKQKLNSPTADVIALLDSAINTTDTLRLNEAAPYFLSRAQALEEEGKYRDAVFDYTRYEYLMRGQVNSQFYFLREQAEMKGKLYQQAIADIARAIILSPQEPTYYAEMANVQLRVNKPEDAIKTAKRCIEIAPEYSEGYLILGLAQLQTKQKQEGLANLQKAKELGNEQAQSLIDKYGK
ncbi:MAG: tetratricopeptide repeat protein [Prevotella sp.]|nr:tetratricopeptide repeat protein [Prevotella sp.]